MTIKLITRKIKEPVLPYVHIQREKINNGIQEALKHNKKSIYLSAVAGYGKTVAISGYLQTFEANKSFWYSLDEWDKDPVTFLNYIYNIFLKKGFLSDELIEFFSQPLNTEKDIKNFVGLMCDELENNLKENIFLIFDNFQEVQDEIIIQKLIVFLLNYCPDYLKIIIISQKNIPEIFYPFYIRQELAEIKLKDLLLTETEANVLLPLLGKKEIDFSNDLFYISQKCISLFILLAQNFQNKDSLEKHYEDIMFKNALNQTTSQIFESLNQRAKDFINNTLFLPRIKKTVLEKIFNNDYLSSLDYLIENGVIISNPDEQEYTYNSSFIPVLTENFFSLASDLKKIYLDKIINLNQDEISETFLTVLIKAELYDKAIEYLQNNYEYYLKNHLYETIELIINSLIKVYPDNTFLIYLQLRLYRSTGRANQALEIFRQLDENKYTPEIKLEQGICEAILGHFKISISELSELEKENKLKLNEYLSLINCLGISYQQTHHLDIALEYFLKAIDLKNKLSYHHELIKIYHNLGLTYTWLGDFTKAISAYDQSLYLAKQIKVIPLAITYNNLGIIHNLQGDYEKAYSNCLEGLELVNKTNNNLDKINITLTLTETYRGMKNIYKVQESMNNLEELLNKNTNPVVDALFLRQKARISIDEGKIEQAREAIFKAMSIRHLSEGDPAFLEYKLELSKVCYYAGEYREAINNLDLVENGIKQEKHFYHLANVYLYKALSYLKLNDNESFEKYKEPATNLIKEKDYRLLAEKINNVSEKSVIEVSEIIQNNILDEPLKIFTFGQLSVSKGRREISKTEWHGKKTKLLFAYILLNKSGINKDQIFQALFQEGEQSRTALHVLVNRLRKALSYVYEDTEIIQFGDDLYKYNSSINYEWDASKMEYLINEAKQAADITDKYEKLDRALKLYKGHFLTGYELESWVFSTQEYYRQLAYKNFDELADYYFNNKQYDKVIEISEQFFSIDNCFEKACKYKMKSLVALNHKQEALKQYSVLEHSMHKVLNDIPSEEMRLFKEKILVANS